MTKKQIVTIIFCWLTLTKLCPQGIAIGQWRDHLPYNSCIRIAESNEKIYAATRYCLFSLDKSDNSVTRITKANYLSDANISTIAFSEQYNTLVVAYTNANIDLIVGDSKVNLADIKRKPIFGDKSIKKVYFYDKYAYLSCGFGIVVIDLIKKEIKDTYYIGQNGDPITVNDIAINGTKIFAATQKGIYIANYNSPNLSDYNSWNKQSNISQPNGNFNTIVYFNNKIYVNWSNPTGSTDSMFYYENDNWKIFNQFNYYQKKSMEVMNNYLVVTYLYGIHIINSSWATINGTYDFNLGAIYTNHGFLDKNNFLWFADAAKGLVKKVGESNYQIININGPFSINVCAMDGFADKIWVTAGGKNADWGQLWNSEGSASFVSEKWNNINQYNTPDLQGVFDNLCIKINPKNTNQVFAGTYGSGILEYADNKFVKKYSAPIYNYGAVTGLCFDKDGNLWLSSSPNLHVLKPDKTSIDLNLSRLIPNLFITAEITIDNYNQKWITLPRSNNGGLIVFSDNGTIDDLSDDKAKLFTTSEGNGHLPTIEVNTIAVDKNGEVWIGTDKGIAVCYTPENIFTSGDFDVKQIMVEQNGYIQPLLEYESVTSIVIDGSNKKWIGTKNSGVYLMSADGLKEIHHFTSENSPLFSNYIMAIAINGETGEVFFGTDKGIISYKGVATEGKNELNNNDVYAYPNPVKSDYNGIIAIKGLTTNADVKITDINGNLVYETIAEGGQAIWNGANFDGKRAQTGVYLVFCSNDDGSKTIVTKILFVN